MGGRIIPDLVINVFWDAVGHPALLLCTSGFVKHLWDRLLGTGRQASPCYWSTSLSSQIPVPGPVVRWELGVQNAHMLPSCLIRKALGWHFPLWGKKCQAASERCHSRTNPCRQSAHTFWVAVLGFRAFSRAHVGAVSQSVGDLLIWVLTPSTATAEPLSPELEHPCSSAIDWFLATQFPEVWEGFELYPKFFCCNAWKMYLRRHILNMLLYRNGSFIMFPLTLECF